MGVSNPMDKYSNYKVIEKDTEFINPLAGLKQQLKGTEESSSPEPKTEESSSTLSASPEPKTEESSSTLSASPESEPEPGFKRIRSMPILSVLSDVSSDSEYSPSPIGIHIKSELDQIDIDEDGDKTLSSIDINEQTPLPVVSKSKLVEISLQTPEPEMVTGVSPFISTPIEEEKKDEVVDIEKGEEVGRARLWRHMLDKDESLMEKICLLYTSPSPRDQRGSRMPSSA